MRGEIWGWIWSNNSDNAVKYAILDATISHSGNGVYGEIFVGALRSLAFTHDNIEDLVKQALEYIPPDSLYYKAVVRAFKRAKESN